MKMGGLKNGTGTASKTLRVRQPEGLLTGVNFAVERLAERG